MAKVIVTSLADADMADIITYLATEAGYRTAAKYADLFDALYDRLTVYPESGLKRPALGVETRIGIVSPFVVVYDYARDQDTVTILRVVHGKRNFTVSL